METYDIILLVCLIPIAIAVYVALDWTTQSTEDYKAEIGEQLAAKGYSLIEIRKPGMFNTGPFPVFQVRFGPQTRFMGMSGEKTRYRIVKYRNRLGIIKRSWVRINVTAFVVVKLKWLPEL